MMPLVVVRARCSVWRFMRAALLAGLLGQSWSSGAPGSGLPAGLTESDWESVRAEYQRRRHAVSEVDGGFRARNPAQRWTTNFDRRGFTVEPDAGGWSWGLELLSYGSAGEATLVTQPPRATRDVERFTYAWSPALEEWYVNDARGLEHGFTVSRAPEGAETLELRLRVRGGLSPRIDANGRGASFVGAEGETVVTYNGLQAWDAEGKGLKARLDLVEGSLRMTVDTRGAQYPITIDPIVQQAYLKASNAEANDGFGAALSLSGNTLAVGSTGEASNGKGINPGSQADNSAPGSGAVYVFQRTAGVWTQQAYIKASNSEAGDTFGVSISLSGDTLAVSAPNEDSNGKGVNPNTQADNSASASGAVYVFQRVGGVWTQQAYIKASNAEANDFLGQSLALSGDTLAVSAPYESSNGAGVNPNTQNNNFALGSGAVYVFQRTGGIWVQQAYIKSSNSEPTDNWGLSVALDGDTLAVGHRFEASNGKGVNPNSQFDNSAPASGAAYLFQRIGGVWTQQAYIKASNAEAGDLFGTSVSVWGDTLAVGATGESSNGKGVNPNRQFDNTVPSSGAVYIFQRNGGAWGQQAYLKASNTGPDTFGTAVGLFGDALAVGATGESSNGTGINPNTQSDNSVEASGAVYMFRRTGGVWAQQAYLKASNPDPWDLFGSSLALSGDTLAVGAHFEDSNGKGVNPNAQTDNSAMTSGAVYVFDTNFGSSPANVGVYRSGVWLADKNGNGVLDPGVDLDFAFGFAGAVPLKGDWNGDGKKEAGLFSAGFWFLDYDGNGFWDGGVADKQHQFGWAGVTPLVGDWNGDGKDTIGIFANGFWFLDANGNGVWNGSGPDLQAEFGWTGVTPYIGDWNGDGRDKIGIFTNGYWFLDYNGDLLWNGPVVDRQAEFGSAGVTPVVGDWSGDGRDKIGIFTNGYWFLDFDADGIFGGAGVDIVASFGFPGMIPVVGDWNGDGRDKIGLFFAGFWFLDSDGSGGWDGGLADDWFVFGQLGDTPMVGPW